MGMGGGPPASIKELLGAAKGNGVLYDDGTCQGVGFVSFIDPASAQNAIAAMNGLT